MDDRIPLPVGALLDFREIQCVVGRELGRGSNAIVYQGSYPDNLHPDERHTVLIKELFPYHPQGAIWRAPDGSVRWDERGEPVWRGHLRSFENGNRIHLRMSERFPAETGANINSYPLNHTYYTILGFTGGRSLREELEQTGEPLRRIAVRLLGILDALACFHEARFLHMDVAPDNVLLIGTGGRERVMLIDYNSAYPLDGAGTEAGVISVKAGYTAPELRAGRLSAACPASDLYSAAAVFYRALSGAALTVAQASRPVPPDISRTAPLQGQPDTVLSMCRQILARGLAALPRRRYQSAAEMRRDVEELIDRIDGIGITHSALWEAGRKSVVRIVRENHALSFLKDEASLFPVSVRRASGEVQPVTGCLSELFARDGKNMFLTGEGGAGKTTALLRFVATAQESYSPWFPAVIYLSLYGRRDSVLDLLLLNLRFRTESGEFAEARQLLLWLLDTPLRTPRGELPTLVLLVDGLNEYSGSMDELWGELNTLSKLRGIRLLLSGRTADGAFPAEEVALLGLESRAVADIFAERGLALPESGELRALLRNPLMLSVFLRSSEARDGQLRVSGREGLLELYFSSLLEKETRQLPANSDKRRSIEAAVRLVLPAVAEEARRKNRPLTRVELQALTDKLYALTKGRELLRVFPEWIGYTAALRGGARTPDEWYGLMIHDILWKRLALLVRMADDSYQLPHQVICEYLSAIGRSRLGRLRRRRALLRGGLALLLAAVIGASVWALLPAAPVPYEAEAAEMVLGIGDSAYRFASLQAEEFRRLADASAEDYPAGLYRYRRNTNALAKAANALFYNGLEKSAVDQAAEDMLASGEVFHGSGKPLNESAYRELIACELQQRENYPSLVEALGVLDEARRAGNAYVTEEAAEQYRELLRELSDADADIVGILYQLAVRPHITELLDSGGDFAELHYYSEFQSSHDPDGNESDEQLKQSLWTMQQKELACLREARAAAIQLVNLCERTK